MSSISEKRTYYSKVSIKNRSSSQLTLHQIHFFWDPHQTIRIMIREYVTKACGCGNILLRGEVQKKLDTTGLNESAQEKIKENGSQLHRIYSSSFLVKDDHDLHCQLISDTECCICCLKCKTSIHLFLCADNAFAQFSTDSYSVGLSGLSEDKNLSFFDVLPCQFHSLITLVNENSIFSEEYSCGLLLQNSTLSNNEVNEDSGYDVDCEDDFELMFSNECDPIVGSYTESMMSSHNVLTV